MSWFIREPHHRTSLLWLWAKQGNEWINGLPHYIQIPKNTKDKFPTNVFLQKKKEQRKSEILFFFQKVRPISWAIAYYNLPSDNCLRLGPNKHCWFWNKIV